MGNSQSNGATASPNGTAASPPPPKESPAAEKALASLGSQADKDAVFPSGNAYDPTVLERIAAAAQALQGLGGFETCPTEVHRGGRPAPQALTIPPMASLFVQNEATTLSPWPKSRKYHGVQSLRPKKRYENLAGWK